MTELDVIGKKICTCFEAMTAAVKETGLTQEEIARFREFLDKQDTVMPMTDPTAYIRGGHDAIEFAQARLTAVKNCMTINETEQAFLKARQGR